MTRGTAKAVACLVLAMLFVPTWMGATPSSADQQLIADGGFEAGFFADIWTEFSTNYGSPICDPDDCAQAGQRSGTHWAWFGGTTEDNEEAELATLSQEITIPLGPATLSFWLAIPACDTATIDTFDVRIDGNVEWATSNADIACNTSTYANEIVDVSEYADGAAHTVEFRGEFPVERTGQTNFFLDDVTLTAENDPPVLAPIGNRAASEGQTLEFTISATDDDVGNTLAYSAANLPSGASFTPATRSFSWTPTSTQAGSDHNVEFQVSDGFATDSETITINVNQAPVLAPIGDKTVGEGNLLQFTISGTDPDNDTLTYSAPTLPTGATFDTGTRTFSWTPGFDQAGSYPNVRFVVSDGVTTDAEDITITVDEAEPTATSLSIRKTATRIKVSGRLQPAHPGDTITVTLYRKRNGAFKPLRSLSTVLTAESEFAARFRRRASGRCRIDASYAGDTDHAPSSARKTFRC